MVLDDIGSDDANFACFYNLIELFGDRAKFDSVPDVSIDMYGYDHDICYGGDPVACHMAAAKMIKYADRVPNFKEAINECLCPNGETGLHDEDARGEYTAFHISAYLGDLEAIDILVKVDIGNTTTI